ncbi:acyl-CoA thioesterase [Haliangium ochraceum]|uniref:Thioesterase superfamily protein n=1 Tax=Haliangium ochraceum (strain DSM 14365 / JCM 11303 / SMP-2) TaxID=502025 RepID=D0LWL3_HALO1|nr:thioesterase family protein [Haliangium ochraceum]ACY17663.1 thioesterase superfamily protein [Haliangium ochraceum DSM 14365]
MSPSFPVRIELPITWGQMDAFGHVNNTVYFRMFEEARIQLFREVGIATRTPNGGFSAILAATQCQFRRPMEYPDTARVETGVSRIGSSSFTLLYRVHSEAQAQLAAEGDSVVVWYDYAAAKSAPLPDPLRQQLERLQVS